MAFRVSGVLLPQNKSIEFALPFLYGIGLTASQKILDQSKVERSKKTKFIIPIDETTGRVLEKSPKSEYVKNQEYCESDKDCLCVSGLGVPFLGCINTFYGPSENTGPYQCKKC